MEDDSIFNADLFDSEADCPVTNRPMADHSMADRSVADRPVSNRPVTDRPVADRSVADHSHANRSLVDHFGMPDRSSGDRNRYDNISSNISYYIRILETYIIFDIYKLLLLLSQGRNYRGTRAGLYKQQERFISVSTKFNPLQLGKAKQTQI